MPEVMNEAPAETGKETTPEKSPLHRFVEHQANAAHETVKAFQALLPPEFREHSRAARREFLQSFKVLLDGAMVAVEKELNKARQSESAKDDQGGPSTTGKSKVKVEVS